MFAVFVTAPLIVRIPFEPLIAEARLPAVRFNVPALDTPFVTCKSPADTLTVPAVMVKSFCVNESPRLTVPVEAISVAAVTVPVPLETTLTVELPVIFILPELAILLLIVEPLIFNVPLSFTTRSVLNPLQSVTSLIFNV